MIKIETEIIAQRKDIYDIGMSYEQSEDVEVGEYLAILDKIKNEVLDNTNIDSNELKEILFERKEDVYEG